MPEIAPVTTPSTPATRTGFTVDTSSLANIEFDASVLQKKVDAVTTRWAEDNMDLNAEAQMWQARNKNLQKTLELSEKDSNLKKGVTVQVPTQDGKPITMSSKMPAAQQEAIWKEAISGNKYVQDAKGDWVMARDANGELIKSNMKLGESTLSGRIFLQNYEGVDGDGLALKKSTGSDDNIRSRNQTTVNNYMSTNSNKLTQATTQSNFALSQLTTSVNTLQQLFTDLFNSLKQISNSISA